MDVRELSAQVAIITDASEGIGDACARALAGAGMRVVCAARRSEQVAELVKELGPERALPVRYDVRSPTAAAELVAAALDVFGQVDTLIATAGIGMHGGILDYPDEALATMIDTNVSGTVWPVRAVLPAMLKGGNGGDLMIVCSIGGPAGAISQPVYAATRFAQIGLASALNRELGRSGIRVSAICPGEAYAEIPLTRDNGSEPAGSHEAVTAEDIASAVLTILRHPRRLRTPLWTLSGKAGPEVA